jgi:hypothetical protein
VPEDQKIAWAEVQQMRANMRHRYASSFEKLQSLGLDELQTFVKRKDVPVIELLVARAMLRVTSSPRAADVDKVREMMCGPEPKQVELSGPGGEPLSPMGNLSQEKLAAAFTALDRIVREAECQQQTQSSPSSPVLPAPSLPPPSAGES